MERACKDWIETYMEYSKESESPNQFHRWAAISAISAALERRVWRPRGYQTVYPSQYIILVAESATCRKSSAISLVENLLKKAEIPMANEKLTIAYLYKFLGDETKEKGSGSIFVIAKELATFLNKESHASGLIAGVTSLYDGAPDLEYKTKTAGIDIIKEPCINILGATTLNWITDAMPGESVEGGFTSRVIFIVGKKPRFRSAWPEVSQETKSLADLLIHDLKQIMLLRGELSIEPDAKALYAWWYENLKEPQDLRLRSFFGRIGDHALKVAIVLAVSESNKLVITKSHIEKAIALVEVVQDSMPCVFRGVVFNRSVKDLDRILEQIEQIQEDQKNNGISENQRGASHASLLARNSVFVNGKEFAEVIDTLKQSDKIEEVYLANKRWYKLKEKRQ